MDTVWHSATNFILERHNKGDWIADNALNSASGFPPAQLYYYANYYHLRPIYAYTSSESRSSMNSNLPHHFLHTRRHTTTTTVKWLTAIDEDIFPRSAVTFFSALLSIWQLLRSSSARFVKFMFEEKWNENFHCYNNNHNNNNRCLLYFDGVSASIKNPRPPKPQWKAHTKASTPPTARGWLVGWLVGCKFDIGR